MTENLKKLERWHQAIESYEKISFPEVKNLLKLMKLTNDEEVKKTLRERAITGAFDVIYTFIKSNGIFFVDNANYDIDDVINSYVELWINAIDSGELENIHAYSQFFHHVFYRVSMSLVESQENYYTIDFFCLLDYFIKEKPDYNAFATFVKENEFKLMPGANIDYETAEIYRLLSDIATNLFENVEISSISPTKRKFLKDLLISFKRYHLIHSEIANVGFNVEEDVTNRMYCEQILERMKNGRQSSINNYERFSRIFDLKFKQNMSFSEIASELGICRENARFIYNSAIERSRVIAKILK